MGRELSITEMKQVTFIPGQPARIRQSFHSPCSGRIGTLLEIDNSDTKGPYLVSFDDGLQFRYSKSEIEPPDTIHPFNVIEMVHRAIHLIRDIHAKSV